MSSAAAETTPIPTATSVVESAVIEAPLSHVWHHIKLESFSDFWPAISKSEFVKGTTNDTDVVKWTFKDGTELEVKQEEHSVSSRLPSVPVFHTGCAHKASEQYIKSVRTILTDSPNRPSTTTSPTV